MHKESVLLIIFKRPELTQKVFEQIKNYKPKKLFVVADGPRNNDEKILTEKTRAIVEKIDWNCEVHRDYSETNMGCRERVVTGINFAFDKLSQNDGLIIFEDDCLPNSSFFSFCENLLDKYRYNDKVMHISGVNFINSKAADDDTSYYFSNIAQIWGWATWKRLWIKYDENLSSWQEFSTSNSFKKIFPNTITKQYFKYLFDRRFKNEITDWDIAWTYTCMRNCGLCITPKINLVENIGSGYGATHKSSTLLHTKSHTMKYPLIHPNNLVKNNLYDVKTYSVVFGIKNTLYNILKANLKDKLPFLFNYIKSFLK